MLRTVSDPDATIVALVDLGLSRGQEIGIAIARPTVGAGWVGLSTSAGSLVVEGANWPACLARVEADLRPRWVWWSQDTPADLLRVGVRVDTCWDLAAVHRLLRGGTKADATRVWAAAHGLDHRAAPEPGRLDLQADPQSLDEGDPDRPARPDGHLRPEWVEGAWSLRPEHTAAWAATALSLATIQQGTVASLSTARSESAAELLCAEMASDGLPIHRATAESLIAAAVGPRPADEREAQALRQTRDLAVLDLVPGGARFDLRSPADVKSMLRRIGVELPDTRAWRLEAHREDHPLIDALLTWRKAERIGTTFGYAWLDTHVGADGRLRGEWSGSDGAAGRMTAQAGLHNLPADLRTAVRAEAGHLFVRADLGQIEPRVLAVVSGDPALRAAAQEDDLYAPVATRLGVDRPTAKIAVLAAMYGQTSGAAGQALRGMERAYPMAMGFLADAARAGMDGRELRTFGGRRIRMWEIGPDAPQGAAAARGRFARNALVQGAAAELFKAWAATVRLRTTSVGARIVLCLHDELLLHVPEQHAHAVAQLLVDALGEASFRWQRGAGVRFVADVSVVESWADAK